MELPRRCSTTDEWPEQPRKESRLGRGCYRSPFKEDAGRGLKLMYTLKKEKQTKIRGAANPEGQKAGSQNPLARVK